MANSCRIYSSEHEKRRLSPAQYLRWRRRKLTRELPLNHPLHSRIEKSGALKTDQPPGNSRKSYTAIDIQSARRKKRTDPDSAIPYLQRSQLVTMWNAELQTSDQQNEHDCVLPLLQELKDASGLPLDAFKEKAAVAMEKKITVCANDQSSTRLNWMSVTAAEIDYDGTGALDGLENHPSVETEQLRALCPSSPRDQLLSPPSSEASNSSEDEEEEGSEEDDDRIFGKVDNADCDTCVWEQ